MTKTKKILIAVGTLIVLGITYWLVSPFWRNITLDEALPVSGDNVTTGIDTKKTESKTVTQEKADTTAPANLSTIIAEANMIAEAHEVQGSAMLVTSGGETFLRFENLKTINGPDLRIYLSSDLSSDDFVDLGPIRATEGNVNYTIPPGTDLSKYKNALIWCRAFGVLFSYAEF